VGAHVKADADVGFSNKPIAATPKAVTHKELIVGIHRHGYCDIFL
jgi:hypothetical protein